MESPTSAKVTMRAVRAHEGEGGSDECGQVSVGISERVPGPRVGPNSNREQDRVELGYLGLHSATGVSKPTTTNLRYSSTEEKQTNKQTTTTTNGKNGKK